MKILNKLLKLISKRRKYKKFTFNVKRNYSYNILAPVYNYSGFDKNKTINLHIEHGLSLLDTIAPSDLRQNPNFILAWNTRRKEAIEKANVPSAVFGAPFVRYRHLAKIEKSPNAIGTIAFPAHSGGNNDIEYMEFDWEKYAQTLKNLPEKCHPITISLHPNDINKDVGKIFEKEGLKVISMQNYNLKQDFMQNFYEVLSMHKYCTSNEIGTSMWYAIEMGLPVFLAGDYPIHHILEDGWDLPKGSHSTNLFEGIETYEKFKQLIPHHPVEENEKELKDILDIELGVNDAISPKELYDIIWEYYDPFVDMKKITKKLCKLLKIQ